MSQIPLDALSAEQFKEQLHQPFRIRADEETIEVRLVEVRDLESHSRREDKSPFSILFAGPSERPLPQRIYRLENDGMGELELFLVNLGPDADGDGMIYEAVFT